MTSDDTTSGARPGAAGPESPHVGSLAEEAAKLLGALQDLTTTAGHEHAAAAGTALGGAAAGLRDVGEHLAGAPECRYCPLCRVVAAVRGTSPEVREHLATAGSALLSAAAALLATPVPDDRRHRAGPVQRIDIDEPEDGRREASGTRPEADQSDDQSDDHSDDQSDDHSEEER